MFLFRTRFVSVFNLALFALLLAACGGSAATPAPTGAALTTASPVASEAASAAASESAASAETPAEVASASAEPSVDVGSAAKSLSSLTSYKVTVTTTGGKDAGTAEVVVVRKPVLSQSFTSTFGGHPFKVITIGSDSWVDEGTGKFVKNAMPAGALSAMTGAFDPGTFLAAINKTGELSALQTVGVEQKNGVSAVHLHGDHSTQPPAGQPSIPPGGTIDIWVATDGNYLVALEFNGVAEVGSGATSGQIEVTNINDPSLTVSPPA